MAVVNGYCSLAALKQLVGVTSSTTDKDLALELAISSASRQIDAHTGWPHGFWQDSAVVTRTYEPDEADCLYVPEGISTTTGLVVKTDEDGDGTFETTLALGTDFILEPSNALLEVPAWPYTELEIRWDSTRYFPTNMEYTVEITAKFGWPAVPDGVEMACLIQAAQLFKAGDAAFGVLQLTSLDGAAVRIGGSLHPQAEALLMNYSKPRVA